MTKEDQQHRNAVRAEVAKGLGPLEMELLDIVWELGRATSRDIFNVISSRRRIGQSTVLTVLRRLTERGLLRRETEGALYVYSAAAGRLELGCWMIDNVVDSIFGGAVDPVIAYLDRWRARGKGAE